METTPTAILEHRPARAINPADDVIAVPSRTRPGGYHFVHVNVLAGCTDSCTCEAAQHGRVCWARKEVDLTEGSYGFARCVECGSLMRMGRWHTRDTIVGIWVCPQSDQHVGREAATAFLFRVAQGGDYAVGSRGAWRIQ